MKTLKLILLALLMMAGFAANAQTIQIYKNGVVVKEYDAAAVDSVIYKPAEAQPRYYYYAGWECPTNETDLANYVKSADGKTIIGGTVNTLTGWSSSNPIISTADTERHSQANWYICIPKQLNVYAIAMDGTYANVTEFSYDLYDSFTINGTEYKVLLSKDVAKYLNDIIIY